jgi:hypothetical protein
MFFVVLLVASFLFSLHQHSADQPTKASIKFRKENHIDPSLHRRIEQHQCTTTVPHRCRVPLIRAQIEPAGRTLLSSTPPTTLP